MNRTILPFERRSFTLLELCIVLFVIALLAGVATPALHSALIEYALRGEAGQVAQLVKTAMLTSSEEDQRYVLQLAGRTLSLAPAAGDTHGTTVTLDHTLQFPDTQKRDDWTPLLATTWQFEPHGLCPLPRLRVEEGAAYLEMSFNALTGDVEDEATYLP